MTLTSGTRLGPYEIQSAIGAGGMGEVYKARDTRLDRSVAVKVLPAAIGDDADRRARFEREAKTIASLNHPHICTLFDVGSTGSPQAAGAETILYLVMEHLQGETLADRLTRGPLPLDQALTVATEIADALAAAHRHGVIHRDLKPGNVMLTKTGAKLLDFGLAKLSGHGERPAAASLTSAPTVTRPLTSEGAIVGTLQYMAPEQVEGKPADARTDLWALGAVVYEMLTGERAFKGDSAASLIGHIMNDEPPALAAREPLAPPALDRLVRQCLAKSPEDRPDTAHDVANHLRWMRETSAAGGVSRAQPRPRRVLRAAPIVRGVLAGAVVAAGLMWLLRPVPPRALVVRTELPVQPADEVNSGGSSDTTVFTPGGSRTALAWTPDGQSLVFVGRRGGVQQLYVRRLDAAESRPLANTIDAQVPAVSPDGQWVAFWADGSIRKVPLTGGPAKDLAQGIAGPPWGLASGTGGRIFFGSTDGRIWAIPPEGAPAVVTTPGEAETRHSMPSLLPGERVMLFTVRRGVWSWGNEDVVAQTLATSTRKVLLRDAADARYVPTGHLVFMRRGVLFAVRFDAERVQVIGEEEPVLDTVAQALASGTGYDVTGAGQFAVAATGALAWLPGPVPKYPDSALVTLDRRGQVAAFSAEPHSYRPGVRRSPDGSQLAVLILNLAERGLWTYDVSRGSLKPVARGGEAFGAVWFPDGRRLAFQWLKDGRYSLAAQPADGTAPAQVLLAQNLIPSSFTRDGRQLAAVAAPAWDIVIVTMEDGKTRVEPLVQTPAIEGWPEFSPNGRWLAYASDVSGRREVYVRTYPGPGPAEPVSLEGGSSPAWNPNGRELFFVGPPDSEGRQRMFAAEFEPGSPPRLGRPRALFDFSPSDLDLNGFPLRVYEVSPDGQRFVAVRRTVPPPPPKVTSINLTLNWVEELKATVPTRR